MLRIGLIGLFMTVALVGCANQPVPDVGRDTPGLLMGVLHGLISPFALIAELFTDVRVYAFPNTGTWYDFGFLLGIATVMGAAVSSSVKSETAFISKVVDDQVERHAAELRNAENTVDRLQKRLQESEDRSAQLSERLRESEGENDQLRENLQESEDDADELRERLRKAQQETVKSNERFQESEDESARLRERLQESEDDADELRERLRNAQR